MVEPVPGPNRKRDAARGIIRFGSVQAEQPLPVAEDSLDLSQIWAAIVERWRFVVAVGALIFGATLLLTFNSQMTFKASGGLYLGDLELFAKAGGAQSSNNLDISGAAQGDVGSEIEILRSQSLVSRAILDSGFNVTVSTSDWKPPRFWQWVLGGRNPKTLDVPSRELLASGTVLADNSRGAQTYLVDFASEREYELSSAEGEPLGRGKLGAPLQITGLTMTLHRGLERGPQPGAHYEVVVRPLDITTDQVIAQLVVTPAKGVGAEAAKVVSLEFSDRSAYFSATLLLRLMNAYLGERQEWKAEDASAAESFVTHQLGSLRDSLDKSERKLADYRSNTRPVVLNNEASALIAQVSKYEEQRVAARLQVAALSEVKRVLKLPNPPPEAFLVGEASDTVLAEFASSLSVVRQQLSDSEQQFGENATQTRQARGQVDAQLQMIRNYVTNRLSRAQESLAALNQIIVQFDEKLKTIPGAELGLQQLGRESEVYSRVYSYMLERQQQAAIIKASTVSKNRILDMPQIPYREDGPKLMLRLASAPLGLLFGVMLVLIHRLFATSLQSQSEVRQLLGAHPVYAIIPRMESMHAPAIPDGDRRSTSTMDIVVGAPNSPYVEAFRALRTNLYQSSAEEGGCLVTLITSPRPGDGKTTCVMSLAEILAADKKRVLVIDGDVRKPTHHQLTNAQGSQGLRGILSGHCDWTDAVRTVQFAYGSFDSIGSGKIASAELLSSERMNRLLHEVRHRYDFVLLDSASFPLVSDALVLATVADCVLSVLRVRNSPRRMTTEHVRRLGQVSTCYGAIIIDSNLQGNEYPLRQREHPLVQGLRRVAAAIETPMARFLGGRFSIIRFWVFLCLVTIGIALLNFGFQAVFPSAKHRRAQRHVTSAASTTEPSEAIAAPVPAAAAPSEPIAPFGLPESPEVRSPTREEARVGAGARPVSQPAQRARKSPRAGDPGPSLQEVPAAAPPTPPVAPLPTNPY